MLQDSNGNKITFSLVEKTDGTGHNTTDACFLNSANGYPGGDDNPTDGVVCSGDKVRYRLDYNFDTAGPLRAQFDLRNLISEAQGGLNPLNITFVTAVAWSSGPRFAVAATEASNATGFVEFDIAIPIQNPDAKLRLLTDAWVGTDTSTKPSTGAVSNDSEKDVKIIRMTSFDSTIRSKQSTTLEVIDGVSYLPVAINSNMAEGSVVSIYPESGFSSSKGSGMTSGGAASLVERTAPTRFSVEQTSLTFQGTQTYPAVPAGMKAKVTHADGTTEIVTPTVSANGNVSWVGILSDKVTFYFPWANVPAGSTGFQVRVDPLEPLQSKERVISSFPEGVFGTPGLDNTDYSFFNNPDPGTNDTCEKRPPNTGYYLGTHGGALPFSNNNCAGVQIVKSAATGETLPDKQMTGTPLYGVQVPVDAELNTWASPYYTYPFEGNYYTMASEQADPTKVNDYNRYHVIMKATIPSEGFPNGVALCDVWRPGEQRLNDPVPYSGTVGSTSALATYPGAKIYYTTKDLTPANGTGPVNCGSPNDTTTWSTTAPTGAALSNVTGIMFYIPPEAGLISDVVIRVPMTSGVASNFPELRNPGVKDWMTLTTTPGTGTPTWTNPTTEEIVVIRGLVISTTTLSDSPPVPPGTQTLTTKITLGVVSTGIVDGPKPGYEQGGQAFSNHRVYLDNCALNPKWPATVDGATWGWNAILEEPKLIGEPDLTKCGTASDTYYFEFKADAFPTSTSTSKSIPITWTTPDFSMPNDKYSFKSTAEAGQEKQYAFRNSTSTATVRVLFSGLMDSYKRVIDPVVEVNDPFVHEVTVRNLMDTGSEDVYFIDILPFNGDGRGSKFSGTNALKQLENMTPTRFQTVKDASGATVPNVTVYYTARTGMVPGVDDTADAPHVLGGGATKWCLETEFGSTGCPANLAAATALMWKVEKFAGPSFFQYRLHFQPTGNKNGDIYGNTLGQIEPSGFGRPIVTTLPVRTQVMGSAISGRVYWDEPEGGALPGGTTRNGAFDPGEVPIAGGANITHAAAAWYQESAQKAYANTKVNLYRNMADPTEEPVWQLVETQVPDAEGRYKFQGASVASGAAENPANVPVDAGFAGLHSATYKVEAVLDFPGTELTQSFKTTIHNGTPDKEQIVTLGVPFTTSESGAITPVAQSVGGVDYGLYYLAQGGLQVNKLVQPRDGSDFVEADTVADAPVFTTSDSIKYKFVVKYPKLTAAQLTVDGVTRVQAPLTNVVLDDPQYTGKQVTCLLPGGSEKTGTLPIALGTLEPGGEVTCSLTTEPRTTLGGFTNTAVATGLDSWHPWAKTDPVPLRSENPANVEVLQAKIAVVKDVAPAGTDLNTGIFTDGNDAASPVRIPLADPLLPPAQQASVPQIVRFRVTNAANEPLKEVKLQDATDMAVSQGNLVDLTRTSCLGGWSWNGGTGVLSNNAVSDMLAPGATITCSAPLIGMPAGTRESDLATATGVGNRTNQTVTATDPLHLRAAGPVALQAVTGMVFWDEPEGGAPPGGTTRNGNHDPGEPTIGGETEEASAQTLVELWRQVEGEWVKVQTQIPDTQGRYKFQGEVLPGTPDPSTDRSQNTVDDGFSGLTPGQYRVVLVNRITGTELTRSGEARLVGTDPTQPLSVPTPSYSAETGEYTLTPLVGIDYGIYYHGMAKVVAQKDVRTPVGLQPADTEAAAAMMNTQNKVEYLLTAANPVLTTEELMVDGYQRFQSPLAKVVIADEKYAGATVECTRGDGSQVNGVLPIEVGDLAVGQKATCVLVVDPITQPGAVKNAVVATGEAGDWPWDTTPPQVKDENDAWVKVIAPQLALTKEVAPVGTTDFQMGKSAEDPVIFGIANPQSPLASQKTSDLVVRFIITNTSIEGVRQVTLQDVRDEAVSGDNQIQLDKLTCADGWSWEQATGAMTNPASENTLAPGGKVTCTAPLSGLPQGTAEADAATTTGVGVDSGNPVHAEDTLYVTAESGEEPPPPTDPTPPTSTTPNTTQPPAPKKPGQPPLSRTGVEAPIMLLVAMGALLVGALATRRRKS